MVSPHIVRVQLESFGLATESSLRGAPQPFYIFLNLTCGGGDMGISDDIRLTKKSPAKKQDIEKPLDPDEIKIKYSREEDEAGEDNLKHQRSRMEDDFFGEQKSGYLREAPEENDDEPEEPKEEPKAKYKEEDYHQPKKHGNPMTKWVVLLLLVLIALLTWQNWSKISKAIGWGNQSESSDEALPKYSSTTEGTDYTSGSTSADSSASTTPDQGTTATTTPSIDKSQITIQVLNGNGISGSANIVKTQLVAAGFTVDSVKNALKFTYQSSIIYYKTGKSAEADLTKNALPDRQCELTNNDSVVGNYDIVIVVGKT